MTFLSTNRNEYDRIGLGCHLYGGIRFSAANPDIPGISPTQRYIAEHNLTRFWQAPHLDPHEVGFSQPVVRMRDLSDDGFNFMRPPGAHRADQPMMRLKRRNLLAGAAHVSRNDTHIPLWMVDESTVRNRIFKLNVGLEFGQEDLPMVTTRVHQDSIAEECIASSDVVQLRTLKGIPNKIAARTVSNLELCGPDMAEPHVLFGQFVDDLVQLPYMEDEMVISDRMGFVWHGKIGEALGRVKHAEEVQHICATDTPRVILAGSSFKLKVVDLREHATAPTHGNVLFEVDDGLPDLNEIEDANEILNNPMTICHVSPIPGQPCYSMLTTERFHFVLDHRMPKKPILEMSHSCYAGGDFVGFGATYIDHSRAPEFGRPPVVMPYYTMNLAVKPALQLWSLYFHPNINAFSSLGPPKNVQSFDAPLRFMKYHNDGEIPMKVKMGTHAFSMHHCAVGDEDALLFRLSDNGVLWYDNVTIKDRTEDRRSDAEVVLSFFHEDETPMYTKGVEPELLRPISTAVTIVDCDLDIGSDDEEPVLKGPTEDPNPVPFLREMEPAAWSINESEIVTKVDEDRVLSNIVLQMWDKMDSVVKRSDAEVVQLNGKLLVPEAIAVEEDPLVKLYVEAEKKKSQKKSKKVVAAPAPPEEDPLAMLNFEADTKKTTTAMAPLELAMQVGQQDANAKKTGEEDDEYDFDIDLDV